MAKKKVVAEPSFAESAEQTPLEIANELHELVSGWRLTTVINGNTLQYIKELVEKIQASLNVAEPEAPADPATPTV